MVLKSSVRLGLREILNLELTVTPFLCHELIVLLSAHACDQLTPPPAPFMCQLSLTELAFMGSVSWSLTQALRTLSLQYKSGFVCKCESIEMVSLVPRPVNEAKK